MKEELTDEQRVLLMALDAFKTTGLDFTVLMGDGEYGIGVDSMGMQLWLTNLIERAVAEPESDWQRHVDHWLAAANEVIARGPKPSYSEDDIREGIRTRLYPADLDPEGLSYAQLFAQGLVLGLAIDSPTTVSTVTTEVLAELPFDIETLFELGQSNTDREPIDEVIDVEGSNCRALAGQSFFIASKAANLPGLLADYIGDAPYGVAFGVPNRQTLLFKVIDKDNWGDIIGIAALIDNLTFDQDEGKNPGGVLSPYHFYRAPDGTIELLGGRLSEHEGELMLTARPGQAFNRFVFGGV